MNTELQVAEPDGSLTRIDYASFIEPWHRKRRVRRRRYKRAWRRFELACHKYHQRKNPCGLPYVYELEGYPQIVCKEPMVQATVRL